MTKSTCTIIIHPAALIYFAARTSASAINITLQSILNLVSAAWLGAKVALTVQGSAISGINAFLSISARQAASSAINISLITILLLVRTRSIGEVG
jgi:hypothetical protein